MYLLCSWIEVVEVSCTHMSEAHPHLTPTPGDPVYSISPSQSTIYTHNAYTYKRGKHSHTWNMYKSFRKQMVGESQGRSFSRTRSRSKSLERFGLFIICHHFGEIWRQRYRWNNLLYKYMVKNECSFGWHIWSFLYVPLDWLSTFSYSLNFRHQIFINIQAKFLAV